jgi:predicted alpha/beta-fold hydrolase
MTDLRRTLEETRLRLPPCDPPFWAPTGHAQTILGHLLPSPRVREAGVELSVTLERETERIQTTYLAGTSPVTVYLFHGLGGSAEAAYMQRTALRAQAQGHHVFLNNHRGCGAGAGLATEPYHSGRADDLSKVIEFGRKMLPDHRHLAVGFSLSANALLLLAAKVRADVQPDAAIAVNAPINLDRASIKLRQGLNRVYDKRFTLELARYIRRNRPADAVNLDRVRDLREFDEIFTAPIGGFRDRADYYATCSAKRYVSEISIPTVVLTAEDDPFVSVDDYRDAAFSAHCFVHIERHGGHMGYLAKRGLGFDRWLDRALDAYLGALAGALS